MHANSLVLKFCVLLACEKLHRHQPTTPHAYALFCGTIPHNAREKRVYTTTVAPLLSRSVTRPRCHREKKYAHTISLGKQGKRVYNMGPERRIYTIEAADPEKEKEAGYHCGGVRFFLPCNGGLDISFWDIIRGTPT